MWGSLPVVDDQQSRKFIGMITDRDLCCSVLAEGLDPKDSRIKRFISMDPVICREGEMKKELSAEQVLAVRCPTCGATPGERCELCAGQPRNKPHRNRRLLASE